MPRYFRGIIYFHFRHNQTETLFFGRRKTASNLLSVLAPDLPSLITCPPMLYRTLQTKNRKSPYLFRIGSGPLAKSSENITAYPQDATGPKRHRSGVNLRILLKAVAQFASPRPNLLQKGAPKGTLKIEKYNYYNRLAFVTQSKTEDAEITEKIETPHAKPYSLATNG